MKTIQIIRAMVLGALLVTPRVHGAVETKIKSVHIVGKSAMASPVHGAIEHDHHSGMVVIDHEGDHEVASTTFLGVETSKVGATLGKQLGLDRGFGLVVARVISGTGAAEALEKHDIIVKFEDQLAFSPDQLGGLVRSKEPGTQVALTIVRGGKQQVVTVELRERKAKSITIKTGGLFDRDTDASALRNKLKHLGEDISREEVEKLMGALGRESGSKATLFSDGNEGPVVRMLNVRRGNIVFTDDEGTTKLLSGDGSMRLIVMNQDNEVLFDGPVDTDEQRSKLDQAIQERLEKVEDLQAMEMKVDHDFEIEDEVHVTVPHASVRREATVIDLIP